jgi:hypothetical protein
MRSVDREGAAGIFNSAGEWVDSGVLVRGDRQSRTVSSSARRILRSHASVTYSISGSSARWSAGLGNFEATPAGKRDSSSRRFFPLMIGKVAPYQPPNINPVAPNLRNARWDEIKDIRGPFGNRVSSKEFGYWFNYFWNEAIEVADLTQAQKVKLSEAFFSVFLGSTRPYNLRIGFAEKDAFFKENVLRQLLLIGFLRVAVEAPPFTQRPLVNGKQLAPAPLLAIDAAQLNLDTVLSRGETLPIAFRSDSRSYEELAQQNGFCTRARQGEDSKIYKDYGLDQPWHPFNNPVYQKSIFLRIGQKNKDNCLHTAISVGKNFAEITHFPILNDGTVFGSKDAEGRFLAEKPLGDWTDQDIATAAAHWTKIRAVKGADGFVDHLEKDNHVHVFHLRGIKGYNTEAHFGGADKFPERGIYGVPLSHFLADLHFVQKWWFNPQTGNIKLYEVVFTKPIKWVPSKLSVLARLSQDGLNSLQSIVDAEIDRAQTRGIYIEQKAAYDRFVAEKARNLNPREKQDVLAAWARYIADCRKTKTRMTTSTEKDHLCGQFPQLAAKIRNADLRDWPDLRKEAERKVV